MDSISQPLSSTTVPSTLSYDAELSREFFDTIPHLTNSPIFGNTKLAIYPMLTALNVVRRLTSASIGSSSPLHRSPRNQNAAMPAAIDTSMNSHLHARRPARKSDHLTPLNEKNSSMQARASETVHHKIFFTFSFIAANLYFFSTDRAVISRILIIFARIVPIPSENYPYILTDLSLYEIYIRNGERADGHSCGSS